MSLKNVSKLQARFQFLQKCQNFQVIPTTMVVKQLNNPNPKLNAKYKNVAHSASKNNLNIATLDAKRMSLEAEIEYTNLLESINLHEKTKTSIEKLSLEFSKQQHEKYTHKLNHLKLKNDIPIDTPNLNTHKKSSKTRRFVPRRKYQKWKKAQSSNKNLDLVHNFSDTNLSGEMISLFISCQKLFIIII